MWLPHSIDLNNSCAVRNAGCMLVRGRVKCVHACVSTCVHACMRVCVSRCRGTHAVISGRGGGGQPTSRSPKHS